MKLEMNTNTRRRLSRVGAGLLAVGLMVAAPCPSVRAQQPPDDFGADAGGGESKGRPLDGYFGTGILAALAVFIIGKGARR